MKITKAQLRQIIREERSRQLNEANADGTISADEGIQFDDLMDKAFDQVSELFYELFTSADRIGGSFRGPGMKKRLRKMIQDQLEKAAKYDYNADFGELEFKEPLV